MFGFFITATNTDRGKTLITSALRLWLHKQGWRCRAMKPVQTGMEGSRLSPDLYKIHAPDYPAPEQFYRDWEPLLPLMQ
ncbi:MAG: dethiobiotin synthase, partial [Spirochaetota bacterium]